MLRDHGVHCMAAWPRIDSQKESDGILPCDSSILGGVRLYRPHLGVKPAGYLAQPHGGPASSCSVGTATVVAEVHSMVAGVLDSVRCCLLGGDCEEQPASMDHGWHCMGRDAAGLLRPAILPQ